MTVKVLVPVVTFAVKMLRGVLKEVDEQWGIADYKETKHLQLALGELEMARKRLRAISRRMRD